MVLVFFFFKLYYVFIYLAGLGLSCITHDLESSVRLLGSLFAALELLAAARVI